MDIKNFLKLIFTTFFLAGCTVTTVGPPVSELVFGKKKTEAEKIAEKQAEAKTVIGSGAKDCVANVPSGIRLPENGKKPDIKWLGACGNGKAQGVGVMEIHAENYMKIDGKMVDGDFVGEVKAIGYAYKGAFMGSGSTFINDPQKKVARLKTESGEIDIDQKSGLLLDHDTGFTWRRCAVGRTWDTKSGQCTGKSVVLNWPNAVKAVQNFESEGYSDWRLPSSEEFMTLIKFKGADCDGLRRKVKKLFTNFDETKNMFSDAHWIADNSNDLKNPKNAQLTVPMIWVPSNCGLIYSDMRLHAELPFFVVRGGETSKEWLVATKGVNGANVSKLETNSMKDGKEYWDGVNRKVENFLDNVARHSAAPSSDTSLIKNSGASGKQFKCEYSCSTSGNFLYSGGSTGKSTTIVTASSKYDAEMLIEKAMRENNACKGLKSSSSLSLTPKAVCRE